MNTSRSMLNRSSIFQISELRTYIPMDFKIYYYNIVLQLYRFQLYNTAILCLYIFMFQLTQKLLKSIIYQLTLAIILSLGD